MAEENDKKTGYSVDAASLKRIGRVVREFETNNGLPPGTKRRSRFIGPIVEGVMLEDLPETYDPNAPTKARFQIYTGLQGRDEWAVEPQPSILTLWNRTASSAAVDDVVFAQEIYPDRWVLLPRGGGGGTQIISFSIVSSDPATRSALVQIEQRAFLGSVYGSILLDTVVTVYDTDGCYLNETNVDLTARRGKAVLMYVDNSAVELHFSGDYEPPEKYWVVLSICCPNIVCEE